jgi:glycosyl transferase family 87
LAIETGAGLPAAHTSVAKTAEKVLGRRAAASPLLSGPTRSGLRLAADKVLFGALPPAILALLLVARSMSGKHFGFDYKPLWEASHHLFHGSSPYPPPHASALRDEQQFVYPPIAGVMAAPLAVFPFIVSAILFAAIELVGTVLTLRVLGVRDWRCYGLALLWLPMIENILIGSISTLLALGLAVAWRYRDSRWTAPLVVAAVIASKVFLWPVLLWLLATRRGMAATRALVIAVVAVVGSWALIGFAGLGSYPRLLDMLSRLEQWKSYSAVAFGLVLGLSAGEARALALVACAVALIAIVLSVRLRPGNPDADRQAFILAIAAAFLFSPIIWMHYLAILVVPIALTRRTLTPLWFVPLAMWATPGQSHGHAWQVTLGLLVWVGVLAASLRTRWPLPAFRRRRTPVAAAVSTTY